MLGVARSRVTCRGRNVKLVPILVGALSTDRHAFWPLLVKGDACMRSQLQSESMAGQLLNSRPKGDREAEYGQLLGKYLDDPGNLFVVSSDFCHWGSRFGYTFYDRSKV